MSHNREIFSSSLSGRSISCVCVVHVCVCVVHVCVHACMCVCVCVCVRASLASQTQPTPARIAFSITHGEGRVW